MADAQVRQEGLDALAACQSAMEEKWGFRGGFLDASVLGELLRTGTDEDVKRFTIALRETTADIVKSTPVGSR